MSGEALTRILFALEGAGQVVAGIADTLQLTHLAHHLTHFLFRRVTQVIFAHLLQIAGNGQLGLVGVVFLLLYLLEDAVKLLLVVLFGQTSHLGEHLLHALGEVGRLLLRLQHSYFWRLHQTCLYILKV